MAGRFLDLNLIKKKYLMEFIIHCEAVIEKTRVFPLIIFTFYTPFIVGVAALCVSRMPEGNGM